MKHPNKFVRTHWKRVMGNEITAYIAHLKSLGWQYNKTHFVSPTGKKIWIY